MSALENQFKITQNALEYARKHIFFWQSSPISGKFDDSKYPYLREPLMSLDDIAVRDCVVYGPSQSLKSVFLQIATAYRLAVAQCSVMCVAQSDDCAEEFSKVKISPFLERLPHLFDMQSGKHTIGLWRWANHELLICGPGENQQNSKSVRYVHSDESHLMKHGTLAALTDRAGGRWNRSCLHVTTAADAGTEVDGKFHDGDQREWNLRCIHCASLFEPLWEDASRTKYNGSRVFQWDESGGETAILDSLKIVCPHCDKQIENTPLNRVLMDDGAEYVSGNPGADASTVSFRWNAFACRFKPLRDLLSTYLKSIESAKLGDYAPYENFVKKSAVRTFAGEIPQVGTVSLGRDHELSQIEVVEGDLVVGSCDVQSFGGFHIWALADVWHPNGDSKRIAYDKLASFDDLRAWQLRHGVKDFAPKQCRHPFLTIDHGHLEHEVFAACARWGWLALKSTDEDSFSHEVTQRGRMPMMIAKPWSVVRPGNSMIGRAGAGVAKLCATRLWSKPSMYPMFYRLKQAETSRKYSIATDINPNFVDQLHSYIPAASVDKKTGSLAKTYWRQIKKDDHAFVCGVQSLMLAMMHGVYSVPEIGLQATPQTGIVPAPE